MKRPSTDKPELFRWLQMQGEADRRILAQLWGLPSESDPAALAAALTDPQRVRQQWERLSDAERAAMTRVLQEGGALPAAILQREWGIIRDPAHFSNPRAYLQALEAPASPAERLYTRGLLVREHDERGPIFRVLNDLRRLLPEVAPRDLTLHVSPALDPVETRPGGSDILDRTVLQLLLLAYEGALTTLEDGALNKASLVRVADRIGVDKQLRGVRREVDWTWIALIRAAAQEAGLLRRTADGLLHIGPEAMAWLGASRAERWAGLLRGWTASGLNELTLMCGLQLRGMPLGLRLPDARRKVLTLLATLPPGVWLPVPDIVAEIERVEPDFLRRDGRYDAALIYDRRGQLIAGREGWPRVEGEFLRALLLGALNWFGLTDAAAGPPQAIRLTPIAAHVLQGAAPPSEPPSEPLSVQGTFEIVCPPGASLLARFRLERVAERVSEETATIYRLTRRSIVRAAERGVDAEEIIRFLEEHGRAPVPQAVAAYIREWAGQAGQLRLEESALLRADDPLHLVEVRRARGIDLPPVEELTPTTWKVAPGDVPALLRRLRRAGWSVETNVQAESDAAGGSRKSPLSEHDLKAVVTAAYAYARVCADLDLPCEVSSSMLMRLQKLVPSRHAAAAWHTAEQLSRRIAARDASEAFQADGAEAAPGVDHYA